MHTLHTLHTMHTLHTLHTLHSMHTLHSLHTPTYPAYPCIPCIPCIPLHTLYIMHSPAYPPASSLSQCCLGVCWQCTPCLGLSCLAGSCCSSESLLPGGTVKPYTSTAETSCEASHPTLHYTVCSAVHCTILRYTILHCTHPECDQNLLWHTRWR